MRPGRSAALIAFFLAACSLPAAAAPLAVCLDEDIPLYSTYHGGSGSGFVLAVAQAVAHQLGRELRVQWYASEIDPDDSPVLDADALLSDGRCQLVGGYPLVREAFGRPGVPTARLPHFTGAAHADRGRQVALGSLAPTRAFIYAPFTVVLAPGVNKRVSSIADLKGLKLGTEAATLADAVLMLYDNGALVDQITHLVPGRHELLPRLEKGEYQASLVELRRFDAYRVGHPATRLQTTGYYYRVGFNIGFVGLASEAELIAAVDRAIGELQARNALAPLAQAVGLTYLPPRQPEMLEHLTLRDLAGGR